MDLKKRMSNGYTLIAVRHVNHGTNSLCRTYLKTWHVVNNNFKFLLRIFAANTPDEHAPQTEMTFIQMLMENNTLIMHFKP